METKQKAMSIVTVGEIKGKGTKRIWIASSNILSSFEMGDVLMIDYNHDSREIIINEAEIMGNHTVSSRNKREPIIDIKNKEVSRMYNVGDKVEVLYYPRKIVIKIAKSQKVREESEANKGLGLFELFSGAGCMSEHFKRQGFIPMGGLELNEQFLSFYRDNQGSDVYTIGARIEDVMPEDFPMGVHTVLAGIPCPPYSQGNKRLIQELKKMREGKPYDEDVVVQRFDAEAMTFYVLRAILAMSPYTVVIEETPGYASTSGAMMLRIVLKQHGYNISETVSVGKHTKRRRWVMVANMQTKVDLDDLIAGDDGLTIGDLLAIPLEEREWKTAEENPRVAGMIRKGLGIRSVKPTDTACGTFTCHMTRHTEPILQNEEGTLYSEFTIDEIANIHGLNGFKLSGVKTLDRQVIGNGVTDQFAEVAKRIIQANDLLPQSEHINCFATAS